MVAAGPPRRLCAGHECHWGEMVHTTALFLNKVYRGKTQIGAKEVI
jgi:hypothetical protein